MLFLYPIKGNKSLFHPKVLELHFSCKNKHISFTDRLIKEKVYQNDLPFFIRFEYELNEVDLPVNSKTILEEVGEIRVLRETSYEFEKRTMEGGLIPDASNSD